MAAGDEPVSFNRKSADLIAREVKNMRGRGRGELPLPRRRRNPDSSGSGSGDSGSLQFLVLTEDCGPATGDLDEVTAVKAHACTVAKRFDGPDVKLTFNDDSLEVWNVDPGKSYLEGQGIWVSREVIDGGEYLEISSANCGVYAEAPP